MVTLAVERLKVIPYLDHANLSGRFLAAFCFYDRGWRMWLAVGEDGQRLQEVQGIPAEAGYFSAEPVAADDLHLPFLNFLSQQACYLDVLRAFGGILDDIFNLSGSLAKLELLHASRDAVPHGLSRMAAGEVEYIVLVCRSLFDLFQEVMAKLWDRIHLHEPSHRQKLRLSFREIVTFQGLACDADRIASRFGLPPQIAACYERGRVIFDELRELRDKLVHMGSRFPHIFAAEEAFLVARERTPFTNLVFWDESEVHPNDLVPLLPVLEMLVCRTFAVFDDFSTALLSTIQFPPTIVPGMHYFVRGDFTGHLVRALASGARRMQPDIAPGDIE